MKYLHDQETAKVAVIDIYQELPEKVKRHRIENFKSLLYVVTAKATETTKADSVQPVEKPLAQVEVLQERSIEET